ncbi:hypothetical protein LWE61_01870 [Sphingobium sufflavum]|uniref:right-handed parallel beta-helix repeat-containing protein n=1 Tax=Sphingobium sufflavum TaxID=1129547 RepID=UPI001F395409|nr:right-handed parallel beta-helix repeat-containing protein [Sphingobium sufflavum]MCE7795299.1 hypothetical protein [Sphingobium sufflavum]
MVRAFIAMIVLAALNIGFVNTVSAQLARTWVSGVGDDANPCSRTAPCATFASAVPRTLASGEVNCLDSGGFGPVTITKAITIRCDGGAIGGILAVDTDAIVVQAGIDDFVYLIGLDLEGMGRMVSGQPVAAGGLNGIHFLSGRSLTIENCSIRNFRQSGIQYVSHNAFSFLNVSGTKIHNSGTEGSAYGIYISPYGDGIVNITRSDIVGNTQGISVQGGAYTRKVAGVVSDTNVNANRLLGISILKNSAESLVLSLDNVRVVGNGSYALVANGVGTGMLVGRSTINHNERGLLPVGGGLLISYGNNAVNGNNSRDGAFSSVIPMK